MSDSMPKRPSFEKFHYGLRTAKNIERKMMCEIFQRLHVIAPLKTYRYVGFGSPYFSDFVLFHKRLGLTDMISIEGNKDKADRFHFNCPFQCVDIRIGMSTELLPDLEWNKRTILWLDYDAPLDNGMLADISTFCRSAVPGSFIAVTVDAQPGEEIEDNQTRTQRLEGRIGTMKLPAEMKERDMAGKWGTARASRSVIDNQIADILRQRSGRFEPEDRIHYRQIFNFQYADGAEMLTVGGMIYDEPLEPKVEQCLLDAPKFVRSGEDACLISTPSLTYKELRHLDAQLPNDNLDALDAPGVPREDVAKYQAIYRYFPTFAEAGL